MRLDPLTPQKPRGLPPLRPAVGDDHTDVSTPPAPWDGPEDEDAVDAPRETAPTAAIAPADLELKTGTMLGEYRIETRIGEGGMGVVFSAVHPMIGKRAAIKILKKELCADPHTVERFIDEARVVNQIGHPNIVDIFAFGEMPDGRSYFVMEWLKGDTLRDRMARGPVDLTEVTRVVRQLARALQAAHDKGVIHRDLKPDNIFLVDIPDELPAVKLLDFGIAKLAHSDHRVEKTATGAIIGTPQYIAPEQAKGYAIDHRADIYALGGIVFELLTGRPPFVADNAMEMVAKHLMETPVRVSTIVPAVPPELDELVSQMLAKQPEARPSLVRVNEVLERSRDRASLASGLDGAPARRAGTERPVSRATTEPPIPSMELAARPAVSAARDAAAPRRIRPLWVVIAGVPIAGLLAFLVVRGMGSSGGEAPEKREPSGIAGSAVPEATTPDVKQPPVQQPPVQQPPVQQPPAKQLSVTKEPVRPSVTAPPVKKKDPPAKARLHLTILGGGPRTEVLVDGGASTPDSLVTLGAHSVEIRSKGMQPQKFTVEVGKGGTTRKIELRPKPPKPDPDDDRGLAPPGSFTPKKR